MAAPSLADSVRRAFTEEAAGLVQRIEVARSGCSRRDETARASARLEIMRALHTLKGAAAAADEAEIQAETHALEEQVRAAEAGDGPSESAALDLAIARALERLHVLLGGPAERDAPDRAARDWTAELLRVRPEKVDAAQALVSELVVARLQHEATTAELTALRDRCAAVSGALRDVLVRADERADAVREPLAIVDAELASLAKDLSAAVRALPGLDAHAASVSASLDDAIRGMRLMPAGPFLEQYARVVREAARASGREVQLVVAAGHAQLDRAVLVRLHEPLLHLVRNAIAHGIESPERRRASGKDPVGTLRIEAHAEGMRARIAVIDDGAGVDAERVLARATQAGLIGSAHDPASIDDDDLLELLVHPGFSTRDHADDLAGRGVGLDVVRSRIEELDGSLRLDNLPGAGCAFTLDVPIAASSNVGLVVRAGEHECGILLGPIERVVRVGPDDVRSMQGRDTVELGGAPVALVALDQLLGIEGDAERPEKRPCIVLRQGKHRLAVIVDDVPGDRALVVKPLGRAFARAGAYVGGAIQADGSIVPILSVPALFERAAAGSRSARVPVPARARTAAPATAVPSVLVVDDSMTMRTLLRNILSAFGLRVTVAHDGASALRALEAMPDCALVITDLQMPGMDGADLCRAVRASPRAGIPIVMVTSVGDPSERARALTAGADRYVVKSEFEQERFLDVVRGLLATDARA